MKNYCFAIAFFVSFFASAQVKGIVKDSISGAPVPYVTISVENEKIGSSSEENGEFTIAVSGKSKNLIFSAMGFERKIVAISNASEVRLKPSALQLDEVIIVQRCETRQKEIGISEGTIHQAFENAPRIDIKFFAYLPAYAKTKYIKQVAVNTDSKLDDASFKIHIYGVDANGNPGTELLDKDFIVSVDKGVMKTKFNLTKFNLAMPKQGVFIGFEKLMVAKNRVERTISDPNTKVVQTQVTYSPMMLYDSVQRDFQFVFTNGKWIRKSDQDPDSPSDKIRIYEPAITLILTN